MLCWRRISAIGTPASPCFRISTIWLSVNRDFRMGISLAPESLRSKSLLKGEAYVATSASAECAWLLWSRDTHVVSRAPVVVEWDAPVAFADRGTCMAFLDRQ